MLTSGSSIILMPFMGTPSSPSSLGPFVFGVGSNSHRLCRCRLMDGEIDHVDAVPGGWGNQAICISAMYTTPYLSNLFPKPAIGMTGQR